MALFPDELPTRRELRFRELELRQETRQDRLLFEPAPIPPETTGYHLSPKDDIQSGRRLRNTTCECYTVCSLTGQKKYKSILFCHAASKTRRSRPASTASVPLRNLTHLMRNNTQPEPARLRSTGPSTLLESDKLDRAATLDFGDSAAGNGVISLRWLRLHCVRSRPQIHSVQFLASAGLQVQEQLHAIGGIVAQHQIDDHRAPAGRASEHFDLSAEVCIGTGA